MPKRHILRLPPESKAHNCWAGFIEFIKKILPCCCCVTERVADAAATAGLAYVGAAAAAPAAHALIHDAQYGAEVVTRDLLDRVENIGARRLDPNDHPTITHAADGVERVTDATIEVARVVATVGSEVVLNRLGVPQYSAPVRVAVNQAAAIIEGVTDSVIAAGEELAVEAKDGKLKVKVENAVATGGSYVASAAGSALSYAASAVIGDGAPSEDDNTSYGTASEHSERPIPAAAGNPSKPTKDTKEEKEEKKEKKDDDPKEQNEGYLSSISRTVADELQLVDDAVYNLNPMGFLAGFLINGDNLDAGSAI